MEHGHTRETIWQEIGNMLVPDKTWIFGRIGGVSLSKQGKVCDRQKARLEHISA